MRIPKAGLLMLLLVLGILPSAMAQTEAAAVPYPNAATPKAIDVGEFTALSATTPISVTLALRLTDLNAAESLLKSLHTPGDAQFHQFLTADQFVARFAPATANVAKVIAYLEKYGLTAQQTTATTLKVTGLPADMEHFFSVSLHSYEVPAHGKVAGYNFHAPLTSPTIPAEISASVVGVVGLDSRPSLRPLHDVAPQSLPKPQAAKPSAGNPFGYLTVTDFANHYDVQPLYNRGVTGSGRTLGIVTFASFTPSDAFAYWSALGLSVNANRIKTVNVDGGSGAPSDASGSLETTLDVEQSGGIAPGANIIVYQAPNTNQGFIDGFAAAIDANSTETLSVSWGDWEWCTDIQNPSFACPTTPPDPAYVQAVHELFVRAAIQGQTLFAASGDDGAYTNNADCPTSDVCSNTLTVDYPASDPAITAGGGTTLPGVQEYCLNTACTPPYYDITIPHERVWGWDYLEGFCTVVLGLNPVACGIFPAGSGGGVSILFEAPLYQALLPAVERSQPGQSWIVNGQTVYALPSKFPGRNVPDVSFNADPETGYVVYYTSSVTGFGIEPGWGGTSFVAPQLNGVSALLGEYLHGSRIGLLNVPLYTLARSGQAYGNARAPLHAIAYGDNWFYYGRNGYNPAAGLGTLDVANFADILRGLF
jgi:subtilase family serine protease